MTDDELYEREDYKKYKQTVVNNAVDIMTERFRNFFNGTDFMEAFKEKVDPWDEAQENIDALD